MFRSAGGSERCSISRRELVARRPAGTRQTRRRPSELQVLLKNETASPEAVASLVPSGDAPETPDGFVTARRKRRNRKLSYGPTSPAVAVRQDDRGSDDSVLLLPE